MTKAQFEKLEQEYKQTADNFLNQLGKVLINKGDNSPVEIQKLTDLRKEWQTLTDVWDGFVDEFKRGIFSIYLKLNYRCYPAPVIRTL